MRCVPRSAASMCRPVLLIGGAALAASLLMVPRNAQALPSFARQTGQGCPACHTNFPELTPFGRAFKLNGYTLGGGESSIPPIAAMVQTAFTNTGKSQPGGAAPHFGTNDNFSLEAASLFYGGKVVDNLGAFVQVTYSDTSKNFNWDNADIRWAKNGTLFDHDLVFGVAGSNNPTVTDIYNSTPAFGFPWASASLAPTPAASTLIEGGLGQQVGGLTAYTMIDNTLYAEFGGYHTLPLGLQRSFGVSTSTEAEIDGVAPYWRFALQREWNEQSVSVGTFGLVANTFPNRVTTSGKDRFADIGIDGQWQINSEPHTFSVDARWVHESQDLTASQPLGFSDNTHNTLQTLNLKASYNYHIWDAKVGVNVAHFWIYGSTDATLYGTANGSPDSNGWTLGIDVLPFIYKSPISAWPWAQVKLSLQYTIYNKFDGASENFDGNGRNASDNNTLFLLAWFAF